MSDKRPKDMTPEEREALPMRDPLTLTKLPRNGVAGDDLIGFWEDGDGQWYRDPFFF